MSLLATIKAPKSVELITMKKQMKPTSTVNLQCSKQMKIAKAMLQRSDCKCSYRHYLKKISHRRTEH